MLTQLAELLFGLVGLAQVFHAVVSSASGTSNADGVRINAGGNVAINMGANSSVGYGWIQSANWGSGYIATAINPNGGNVGIGTSSPGAILDVKVASDAKLLVQDGNTTGNVKLNAVNNAVSANVNLEISASNTQFFNGGSEKARIDSSGRLLVGTSSTVSAAGADAIQQIHSNNYMQLALINNVNAAGGCGLALGHSRGASAGTFNLLNDGDEFGAIYFVGADGTDLTTQGATIRAEVDGGRLVLRSGFVFSLTAYSLNMEIQRLLVFNLKQIMLDSLEKPRKDGKLFMRLMEPSKHLMYAKKPTL
jgi:hypothetical protein